ncbi:MAG: hypothetical protein ACXABY_08850 [Candidatus Thorarchaeota archaeon]|jgi:hypothetical protein
MALDHPNEMAGSALGVLTANTIDFRTTLRNRGEIDFGLLAEGYKAGKDTDHVNSMKFPSPESNTIYLADGTISIDPEAGEFVLANDSRKPTSGALRVNQQKSSMVSTGSSTTLGSETIKTLTGLILNPGRVSTPSAAFTPLRAWLPDLLPSFSILVKADIAIMKAMQAMLVLLTKKLFEDDETRSRTREVKDIGTLIVDNQDFELAVLNDTVGEGT